MKGLWANSSMSKGKPAVGEKGKRASHCIKIGMDFDPKISRLCNQEEVDKYLTKYRFRLNQGVKVKFCPHGIDVSQAPPNGGVYMHP